MTNCIQYGPLILLHSLGIQFDLTSKYSSMDPKPWKLQRAKGKNYRRQIKGIADTLNDKSWRSDTIKHLKSN